MKIVKSIREWKNAKPEKTVGFVPTMGALHRGHLSLVEEARNNNSTVVVSIFVNPTQFNDKNDFHSYPNTWEKDISMLKNAGVDYVFSPEYKELYSDEYRYQISEKKMASVLCGESRPGHFDGVLTVVMKLLNIIKPQFAYFGKKDYQQYMLIRDMVATFFIETQIVGCDIIRETDGLAMSSRNLLLSEPQRKTAPLLYKILQQTSNVNEIKKQLAVVGFKVDYVEEFWQRRFAAAFLGKVRLIDNVPLGETYDSCS
ncbi:pantoate--beta-alanine ligase [Candidatus Uabimicrobium sp. HlEnr_7]|uniref:pantoate--beta-alanine ligase n=1 Tax=Candidatus Uabimicrobium helgolandensis TaxID=3095367 RepID=UPI0035590118